MPHNLFCGIVGLPNVGKSTLFSALTRKRVSAENYPFCTIDPNIGVVEVFDPRLVELAQQSKSEKTVYATVSFVDIAGLVRGASKGEGLGNQFLANIRETDAIIHIVRCFDNEKILHVEGKTDPLRDIEIINIELILADLQMAENTYQRLVKQAKGKPELSVTLKALEKATAHLNLEKPLRSLSLTEAEKLSLKSYPFLTGKKVLYVANIAEEDLPTGENEHVRKVATLAKEEGTFVIPLCAKLEAEIAQLEAEEAKNFLQELHLKESGLDRLTHAAFCLLDLITFITTGEMETKAWTIRKGTSAVEAAAEIHGDIAKGFIRAEVVCYSDMILYKGRVGAREAGKARSEGRNYIVQDGDVILFFHSA